MKRPLTLLALILALIAFAVATGGDAPDCAEIKSDEHCNSQAREVRS